MKEVEVKNEWALTYLPTLAVVAGDKKYQGEVLHEVNHFIKQPAMPVAAKVQLEYLGEASIDGKQKVKIYHNLLIDKDCMDYGHIHFQYDSFYAVYEDSDLKDVIENKGLADPLWIIRFIYDGANRTSINFELDLTGGNYSDKMFASLITGVYIGLDEPQEAAWSEVQLISEYGQIEVITG